MVVPIGVAKDIAKDSTDKQTDRQTDTETNTIADKIQKQIVKKNCQFQKFSRKTPFKINGIFRTSCGGVHAANLLEFSRKSPSKNNGIFLASCGGAQVEFPKTYPIIPSQKHQMGVLLREIGSVRFCTSEARVGEAREPPHLQEPLSKVRAKRVTHTGAPREGLRERTSWQGDGRSARRDYGAKQCEKFPPCNSLNVTTGYPLEGAENPTPLQSLTFSLAPNPTFPESRQNPHPKSMVEKRVAKGGGCMSPICGRF